VRTESNAARFERKLDLRPSGTRARGVVVDHNECLGLFTHTKLNLNAYIIGS
jgi:hypothetical protein